MKFEQIKAVHRNGNLHVKIFGDFDTAAANDAISVINEEYQGRGNVFINTEKMGAVQVAGAKAFRHNMSDCTVHHRNLFMIGKKGMDMVPEASGLLFHLRRKRNAVIAKIVNVIKSGQTPRPWQYVNEGITIDE